MIVRRTLLLMTAVSSLPAVGAADVLVLPAGNRRVECVIQQEDATHFHITTARGETRIPKRAVVKVERASGAENDRLLAQWKAQASSATAHPSPAPPATPTPRTPATTAPRHTGREVVVDAGDANFDNIVLRSEFPVLVDFYATWCGPCRAQAPILKRLSGEYYGRVRFVRVDVDRNPASNVKYDVTLLPTLMLFDGGKVVQRLTGYHSAAELRPYLDTLARD